MTNLQRFTEILKNVIDNKSGATLGLGARDFLKVKNFKNGYQVGGYSKELVIPLKYGLAQFLDFKYIYMLSMELLRVAKIDDKQPDHEQARGLYLGFWIDADLLYIEISKRIISKKQAVDEAKKREQLAIYDYKNQTSIYIK